jgi:predicted MFS family arabinose efflux permease
MLLACAGGGALASSLYLAARRSVRGIEHAIGAASLLAGIGLLGFALVERLWLAMPALVLAGGGIIGAVAGANTLIQSLVADEVRGRVMSIFTMAFLGTAPLGSLAGGAFADAFGAPATLAAGGLCCVVAGLMFRRERGAFAAALQRAELAGAAASKKGA